MQTVGYWCDHCRVKYVQHKCRDNLPCGHDASEAVYVYAKAYGKGGEFIVMRWRSGRIEAWINKRERGDKNVVYCGGLARTLWGYQIETEDGTMPVGEWLRGQDEKIIRAFLARWDSRKEPPDWVRIMTIPDEMIEMQREGESDES